MISINAKFVERATSKKHVDLQNMTLEIWFVENINYYIHQVCNVIFQHLHHFVSIYFADVGIFIPLYFRNYGCYRPVSAVGIASNIRNYCSRNNL